MAAYSQDLRDRALKGLERGEEVSSIAQRLEVSEGWVYKVRTRLLREGERTPKRVGGYRRSRIADKQEEITDWIRQQPGLTLSELCDRIGQHGILLKTTALWTQLAHWGLTYKKNAARKRAERP